MPDGLRPPPPDRHLAPYPQLVDAALDRGWTVELDWDEAGWRLDLRDQGDLRVRVHSRKPTVAAACRELGVLGAAGMLRTGGS
jgi:hypothetical protein